MGMPKSEPTEIHIFYELTYGKWHAVLRFTIPHRDGFADFLSESHYNFWLLVRELEWIYGRPLPGRLKIKPKVQWYESEWKDGQDSESSPTED